MQRSTSNTFLYYSATESGPFEKLVDITSYPDMDAAPEKLDVSDLSSNQKKYIPGMVDVPDMAFGFVYKKEVYDAAKAKESDSGYYQLRFGENGEYGAWQWYGTHRTTVSGGNVGAVRQATLTMYPDGEIKPVTISAAAGV